MTKHWKSGFQAASLATVTLIAAHNAHAQQVSDEVKKAIQAAVQASVADTIDKTVQLNVVAPTAAPAAAPEAQLVNTFWARPQFAEFYASFAGVNSHIPVEIAPVGAIIQVTPDLYGGISATYAHAGGNFTSDTYGGDGTLTYIFYRNGPTNFRANADFGILETSPSIGASATGFGLTPSVDFETAAGQFVLTFSPGWAFGWSDPAPPKEPSETALATVKVTYLGGHWQPQIATQFSETVYPAVASTVSFTPEINYVDGPLTVGVGYQYTTNLKAPNFFSHAALVNFRYRF